MELVRATAVTVNDTCTTAKSTGLTRSEWTAIAKGLCCNIAKMDTNQGDSELIDFKCPSSMLTEPLVLLIQEEKTYILYTGKQGKAYAEGTVR